MIYLIKSENLYKIGYSINLENRYKSYKLHNPTCELLYSKEGSYQDEQALHKLCSEYNIGQPEWYNSDEVIDIFKNYECKNIDISKKSDEIDPYSYEYLYKYTFCENFNDMYHIKLDDKYSNIKATTLAMSCFFSEFNLGTEFILTRKLFGKISQLKSPNTIKKFEDTLIKFGFLKRERFKGRSEMVKKVDKLFDRYTKIPLNELSGLDKYYGLGDRDVFGSYYVIPFWDGKPINFDFNEYEN